MRLRVATLGSLLVLAACSSGPGAETQGGAGGLSAAGIGVGGSAGAVMAGGAAAGSSGGAAGASAGAAGAGGLGGSSAGNGGTGGVTDPAGAPIFVAVGYTGRRVRSLDLGITWVDEQTLGGGGDDEFLLRAVGFGRGVFVALGWKILSSPDGKTWSEQTNPQHQWLGGVQLGAQGFLATGGYGYCARSSDGKAWMGCKAIPDNEASRSLAVGMGMFVTATDPGNWFESSDGSSWTLQSSGHGSNQIAFCDGAFHEHADCDGAFNARGRATAAGVTLRLQDGKLQRSTAGSVFSPVAGSPSSLEDVAAGFVQ